MIILQPTFADCRYCIDGNQPAGIHDVLGPVYAACTVCDYPCQLCEGEGRFPADCICLPCFVNDLTAIGLRPVLCAGCTGVLDLIPATATSEAIHHVHY